MNLNLFRLAFPIVISYFFLSISFSILAKNSPLNSEQIALLSLLVYAGAAQFVAVELFKTNIGMWEIVLTTLIINSRMWVYNFVFLARVKKFSFLKKLSLLIGITDENYVLFSFDKEKKLLYSQFLFIIILLYAAWNTGTLVGIHFVKVIPDYIEENVNFLYYLLFIILLFEFVIANKIYFVLVLIAIVFNFIFQKFFDPSISLVIATLISSFFFTLLNQKIFKNGNWAKS